MGQQSSGFVVEIASPRLGQFQAVPQKDPDESNREWRITVNPAVELNGSPRLRALIDRLYHHQKLLTAFDAKQILSALQCMDSTSELLLPILTVLSNATAFPSNQLLMSEFRLTNRVVDMLPDSKYWSRSTRVILLQCIANMAVSSDNVDIINKSLNHIVARLSSEDEMEVVVAMQALTNLSVNIRKEQISKFIPIIPHCLDRLWIRGEVNLNALRLLVNLSCCPDMVAHLLGNKSVAGLLRILDTDREEVLIRAITWILCTTSAVDALHLTYDRIAPHNLDPFHNPFHTLYYSLYGPKGREELEVQTKELTNHSNKDVASKSTRLLETLTNIPPFPAAGCHLNQL
uniref:Arm_2 domain-containing protein n=1 Tax=Caenorhabditis japonica TaxID=281687 RepID=A0A8R1HIF8_CAEJA